MQRGNDSPRLSTTDLPFSRLHLVDLVQKIFKRADSQCLFDSSLQIRLASPYVKNKFAQTVFFAREHLMTLYSMPHCVFCRVGLFSFLWYHLHLVKICLKFTEISQKLQRALNNLFLSSWRSSWLHGSNALGGFYGPPCYHAFMPAYKRIIVYAVIWPTTQNFMSH